MITSDWSYMTDPAGDHNPESVDVINNAVPTCCYYASSATSMFFRMAVGGDPLNSKGELDQYAWMAQIDIADDGNYSIATTVRAEGITEYLSTYNGSGTQMWTVADPVAAGYIRSYPSGSVYYLEMQVPYSAMGSVDRNTPIRFFFHTSTTETNDIKDATIPSTTITGGFQDSGTTTPGGGGSYGIMYDTEDTNPYSSAGYYNSGELVYLTGFGWPSSTTLNVRIKNSGGTVMWSGTVNTNAGGDVTSTAAWTIDYSAASGLYTIAVQSPLDGQYHNYDTFTVTQLMEPEINVTGNSITIPDGDSTPSSSDHTDFGTVDLNTGSKDRTFTIQNIGNTSLSLNGTPMISIGGTNPEDFTVTQQAGSVVAAGNSVTFTIRFDPSALGVRTAEISLPNDDSNENPYNFTIQGTGALIPEIDVTGNGISIENRDTTPNSTDETYFGDVQTSGVTQVHTYRINNNGSADLTMTGTPMISIGGTHASDFTVAQMPSSPVAGGSYTTFVITFDPSAIGLRTATVTLSNNDLDEDPYTFAISGTGISNGTPFSCSSRFYHFYGSGTLVYLNTGTNPFSYSTFGSAGTSFNAAGYNSEDGMMYANTGSNLIRIDGSGVITVLSVTNPFASNAGDCDESGNYYFVNTPGNQLAKYDVSANSISTSSLSGSFPAQDMVYISGQFWGVSGTTLYQLNPSSGSVGSMAITGTLSGESGLNGSSWSAAWTSSDGYLYVVNENSHRFYKIDVSTGLSFYSGTGSGSLSNSDGASCHSASCPMPNNGSAGNFVWRDNDNDGIQDSGEPGLANVTITLYRRGGTQIASTTSSSGGTYSFSGISPEQYYIMFSSLPVNYQIGTANQGADDGLDSDPDAATGLTASFIIDAYETKNTWDAACVTTGVGDFVWNDLDGDGLQDAGEPGVANVTVTLQLGNGTDVTSTTTSASGYYQFIGITAGTQYQLYFSNLPGGYSFTSKDQGTDDTIDSDANSSTAKTAKFTPAAGRFDDIWDAGVSQTVFPEINVQGNSTDIPDGDTTPSVSDHTDFGSSQVGSGTVDRTFTVQNTGTVDLAVSVIITGAEAADFTVIASPLSPVPPSGSTTLTIRFDPSGPGLRTATLSIDNNDPDENPYDFAIQGTGLAPEMDVQGNSFSIIDGDGSPEPADDTDFGPADITTGSVVHTFTILNTGTSDLNLSGTPRVQISGTHAGDFSVTQEPVSGTVGSSGSVTFQITFDPSANGLREAAVTIANSDEDENPYNFSIQGTGTSGPEMDVKGKGVSIADGDITPSTADDTNYGTVNIAIGSVSRTFFIYNLGNALLNLTGTPIVELSAGTEFSVTAQPASSAVTSGGGSETFSITFAPTSVGVQTATVSITNDDSDENPYTFTIRGEGITEPEMAVLGGGVEISDGDDSPDSGDATDWGTVDLSAGTINHTFTIRNDGNAGLLLTGTPYIAISGSADFSVSSQPPSGTVNTGGGTTTFTVGFNPSSTGIRTAVISIDNNDSDENPYQFTLQGEGVSVPEMDVLGNGTVINDGDNTPSLADHTDFGSIEVGGGSIARTFTIRNDGSSALSLTGTPMVAVSGSSDFTVSTQPSSNSIAGGGSTLTFTVEFDPSGEGLKTAVISISNNDPNENPYNFTIQGTGNPDPPVLVLSKSVDKASAVPGEELTYTIDYENIGTGSATSVTILEPISSYTTYVQGSVTAAGMTISYSHNNGAGYDGSDAAPVTHIKFNRVSSLPAGSSGSIVFRVTIN